MGGGGVDVFEGGKLLRDEERQLLDRAAAHQHHQVIGAAHQVDAGDLLKPVDVLGDAVKALVALRRDAHLDERLHLFAVGQVPVDHGGVFDNDAAGFHAADGFAHGGLVAAGHHRDARGGRAAVVL